MSPAQQSRNARNSRVDPPRTPGGAYVAGALVIALQAFHLVNAGDLAGALPAPLAGALPAVVQFGPWVGLAIAVVLALMYPRMWKAGLEANGDAFEEVEETAHELSDENLRKLRERELTAERLKVKLADAEGRNKTLNEQLATMTSMQAVDSAYSNVLVQSAPDAVFLTDRNGVVKAMSGPAARLCAVSQADAMTKPFDEVCRLFDPSRERPEEHPIRRTALNAIEAGGRVPKLENALLQPLTGKSHHVLVTSMAVMDQHSQVVGSFIRVELDEEEATADGVRVARVVRDADPVTGLPTKDNFLHRLRELLAIARNQGQEHHLIFMAPDNFDFVIGRYGHQGGEQLMWQLGESMRQAIGDRGDCFAVSMSRLAALIPQSDLEEVKQLAARLAFEIGETTITWEDEHLDLNVSTAIVPIGETSPGEAGILDFAEQMLRTARRSGGTMAFSGMPSPKPQVDGRFTDQDWVKWIEKRLESGLGHIMTQELRPTHEKDLPLMECYVRVEDNDGVWITPKDYLPALSRAGCTSILDLWVLQRLLEQMSTNESLVARFDSVAINIARESLLEPEFTDRMMRLLDESPVNPRHICFEFNENTATSHVREFNQFIKAARELGAKISIDNCHGVGMQSMLRTNPPDFVKIDRGLTIATEDDKLSREQVRWIVASAQLAGSKAVGCGAEDESQIERMYELGVDYIQGAAVNKIGPLVS